MAVKNDWIDRGPSDPELPGVNTMAAAHMNQVANEVNSKGTYTKPGTGIPSTDLTSAVQTSLTKADASGTYTKPGSGIPSTDMTAAVQASLAKADAVPQSLAITTVSKTANYTLALADLYKVIEFDTTVNATLTIPPNSSVNLPPGAWVKVVQLGTGSVSVINGVGVTLFSADNLTTARKRYSEITVRQRATNAWHVTGDLQSATTSPFVYVSGTNLMLQGSRFTIHGATNYGQMTNQVTEVARAKAGGLNVLELVRYEQTYNSVASQTSSTTLTRVDNNIAECAANGIKIILNFSGYFWSLKAEGQKAVNVDWNPFLTTMMNRVNTVTGVTYKDDPTIAMIELIGEIDDPNGTEPTLRGTNAEILAFFTRTLNQLRAIDQNHVLCTGGFSYINIGNLQWQPLMDLANNQVCAFEINSFNDRDVSAPLVTDYAQQIGKPWFLAAFSACTRAPNGSYDINAVANDTAGAAHFDQMYQLTRGNLPTYADTRGCGADFWNLAPAGECDIGEQKPLTFGKVQQYSPVLNPGTNS